MGVARAIGAGLRHPRPRRCRWSKRGRCGSSSRSSRRQLVHAIQVAAISWMKWRDTMNSWPGAYTSGSFWSFRRQTGVRPAFCSHHRKDACPGSTQPLPCNLLEPICGYPVHFPACPLLRHPPGALPRAADRLTRLPSLLPDSPLVRTLSDTLAGLAGVSFTKLIPQVNASIAASTEEPTSEGRARLEGRLQLYCLTERQVKGDGACQFRSLSDQLYRWVATFWELCCYREMPAVLGMALAAEQQPHVCAAIS